MPEHAFNADLLCCTASLFWTVVLALCNLTHHAVSMLWHFNAVLQALVKGLCASAAGP